MTDSGVSEYSVAGVDERIRRQDKKERRIKILENIQVPPDFTES